MKDNCKIYTDEEIKALNMYFRHRKVKDSSKLTKLTNEYYLKKGTILKKINNCFFPVLSIQTWKDFNYDKEYKKRKEDRNHGTTEKLSKSK